MTIRIKTGDAEYVFGRLPLEVGFDDLAVFLTDLFDMGKIPDLPIVIDMHLPEMALGPPKSS